MEIEILIGIAGLATLIGSGLVILGLNRFKAYHDRAESLETQNIALLDDNHKLLKRMKRLGRVLEQILYGLGDEGLEVAEKPKRALHPKKKGRPLPDEDDDSE